MNTFLTRPTFYDENEILVKAASQADLQQVQATIPQVFPLYLVSITWGSALVGSSTCIFLTRDKNLTSSQTAIYNALKENTLIFLSGSYYYSGTTSSNYRGIITGIYADSTTTSRYPLIIYKLAGKGTTSSANAVTQQEETVNSSTALKRNWVYEFYGPVVD